jgi:exodeoxyribonuclease VII large subunit
VAAPERPAGEERRVHSVSAFNRGIAGYVDRLGRDYWVEGELSELSRNDRWAYVFGTLKDPRSGATLPLTMLRQAFDRLPERPAVGTQIIAGGRPRLHEPTAKLALHCRTLEAVGDGALLARIERLRRELADEGLFDEARKRPLPFWPRLVGLVSGSDAAASRDVVDNARRRFPAVRFLQVETAVQGVGAAQGIVAALRRLDAHEEVDVIVLTRGGGSLEDLLPFSDERVCRAIAALETPLVSAVGHERDTPLCDLVADARASTPTAAARLIVPDRDELTADLDRLRAGARRGAVRAVEDARRSLAALAERPALRRPEHWLETRRDAVARARVRLDAWPRSALDGRRERLEALRAHLRALAPSATLERGYAIVLGPDGRHVDDAASLAVGDEVELRLARGRAGARIERAEADG